MHYDLMTGLYQFNPFLWFSFFELDHTHYIAYFSVLKLNWNSKWGKSGVKREIRDLCKTENVIER